MADNGRIVRKHIFFSGRVTGVGFRYRTKMAAEKLGLTGWVRNTSDDMNVEMEVQGTEEKIAALLSTYRYNRWINITSMDVTEIPVIDEKGFSLLFYRGGQSCDSLFR